MTFGLCLRGGGTGNDERDDEADVGGVGVGDGEGAQHFLRRPPFREEETPADPPHFHFGAIHARE